MLKEITQGFVVTLLGLFLIYACTKDEEPTTISLKEAMTKANIEAEGEILTKANGQPTDIECLSCTYFISGRNFPIDSVRAGATTEAPIQFHVVDSLYNFKAWIKQYNIPGSLFVNCDFTATDYFNNVEPCVIDETNIIPLNGLVKIAVVNLTTGEVDEFFPEGYRGTKAQNNIEFLYKGKFYLLTDALVTLTCPD